MGRIRRFGALLFMLSALLALSACRKKVDTSVSVLDPAGGRIALDGTWFACHDNSPDPDDGEILLVASTAMTQSIVDFTTTGGYCLTGEKLRWSASYTLSGVGNHTMSGWSDGTSPVAAPARRDGAGSLDDPPSATWIQQTVGTSDGSTGAPAVGTKVIHAYLQDDTGSTPRLYRDTSQPSPTCDPLTDSLTQLSVNGGCLSSTDYLTQVESIPGVTTQLGTLPDSTPTAGAVR